MANGKSGYTVIYHSYWLITRDCGTPCDAALVQYRRARGNVSFSNITEVRPGTVVNSKFIQLIQDTGITLFVKTKVRGSSRDFISLCKFRNLIYKKCKDQNSRINNFIVTRNF